MEPVDMKVFNKIIHDSWVNDVILLNYIYNYSRKWQAAENDSSAGAVAPPQDKSSANYKSKGTTKLMLDHIS